jgi:hypothetical protein
MQNKNTIYVRRWFKRNFYSDDIWKQRLLKENIPKTGLEQIESNGKFFPCLYPIRDLAQGNFHRSFDVCTKKGHFYKGFHVCTYQGSFLKNFLINNELEVN